MLRRLHLHTVILILLALALAGCGSLPRLDDRPASTALTDTGETRLGRTLMPKAAGHPGLSGVLPLLNARDAFAARVWLARSAERSLDVQYYIWHLDRSGTLLIEALREAAGRGVRVRLLLDDNNTAGLDPVLAALDAHPNIEVRLFNPFPTRGPRWLDYLSDFPRLNRRMHNKSFTADNQATLIGGRNIGDEYFGADDEVAFLDLDVMATGPVVREVSSDFDRYWASESAYPVDRLLPPAEPVRLAKLAAEASLIERDPEARAYVEAVAASPFAGKLDSGDLPFEWAVAHLVSDDPAKALDQNKRASELTSQLARIIGEPKLNMELVSPYFVPTKEGTRVLADLATTGVKVRVLTNSLAATDVSAVHAGYAKRRKALLGAGISLYELPRRLPGRDRSAGQFGSSSASLHAKTFAVDGTRIFIGSFNFDPRSARLNTELGFVIESPTMARRMTTLFDQRIPILAYEARLSDSGELYWLERRNGQTIRHDDEPGTGFWRRTWVWFVSKLPIEWLL
jgi:putative cardiolipin synthase